MRLERVPWLPLAVGPYTSTFRHLPNFVDDEILRAQTTHLRQDCSHKSNTVLYIEAALSLRHSRMHN